MSTNTASKTINSSRSLGPPPITHDLVNADTGKISTPWILWLQNLYQRVGIGANNNIADAKITADVASVGSDQTDYIDDTANQLRAEAAANIVDFTDAIDDTAQQLRAESASNIDDFTAQIEEAIAALRAEFSASQDDFEGRLDEAIAATLSEVAAKLDQGDTTEIDVASLILSLVDTSSVEQEIADLSGVVVNSFNGRNGIVSPVEGDYALAQLSDVTITTPSIDQHLTYNGTEWVNSTITPSGVTSITGTANQVIASASTGSVTLSLPQNIHTGSTPTFAGGTFNGATTFNTSLPKISAAATNAGIDLTNTTAVTGRRYYVSSNSSGNLVIYDATAGSTRISVGSTGLATFNAGITVAGGTTTLLAVNSGFVNITATGAALVQTVSGNITTGSSTYHRFNDTTTGNCAFIGFGGGASTFSVHNYLNGSINFITNAITRVVMNASGGITVNTPTSGNGLTINGKGASIVGGTTTDTLALKAPSTVNAATYTVVTNDSSLLFTTTACTVTLPSAATYVGRILYVNSITATIIISASANVVPLGSSTPGVAMLAGLAGNFAMLQSDGTNWITIMAN